MGCLFSYFGSSLGFFSGGTNDPNVNINIDDDVPKVYSWDTRKKVDPKDFMLENKNAEVIVKLPGSVDGMQFIIQNLANCTVYIFDHIAQISIDDCTNCKFFIGPSKGSVFIRDCVDCSFAVMCQQYRTRDCKRITTFLSCATQPIIESSVNMKFGCISVSYNELADQLKAANVSPFINNWNNVHDFTPVPGESNYTCVRSDQRLEDYIKLPEDGVRNQLNVSFAKFDSVIPHTSGTAFRSDKESCLIVLFMEMVGENANLNLDRRAYRVLSTVKNSNVIFFLYINRWGISKD